MKILIVEDEPSLREIMVRTLTREHYVVEQAADYAAALDKIAAYDYDCILLDIMLPVMDGWQVCREVRAVSDVPIIMLTAKGETYDKVSGLEMGADDYVTKPFDPIEVQARVRSQLRRYTRLGGQQKREQPKDTITIGGVELNDAEKSVTVDGEPVQLTPIEYNILHLLMRNPNRVFSSTQIYELVWNENSLGAETSVAVHIRHLRQKIEINPSEPRYLKVVWGLGYKMEDLRHEKE